MRGENRKMREEFVLLGVQSQEGEPSARSNFMLAALLDPQDRILLLFVQT